MYTLDVHCISLVATDVRYVICGVNWAASLPSSLFRLPPSISPWARHYSTSQNPLQYLDLKTILASPEQEWPDQIIWTINLGLKASIHFQAAVVPNSSFVNSCCPQALLTDCEHLQTEACKRGFYVKCKACDLFLLQQNPLRHPSIQIEVCQLSHIVEARIIHIT